jgi:dTDP-4-amino-4,6-dideoxygalactose transaminase
VQRIRLHALRGNDAYPLSELQACVLLPQLARLDERNDIRERRVRSLQRGLETRPGLTSLQRLADDCRPAYYKVAFRYDAEAFGGLPRETFVQALRREGIPIDTGFRALHLVHSRARFRAAGGLTEAAAADRALVVLHHPLLLEEHGPQQFLQAVERIERHAERIAVEVSAPQAPSESKDP